MYRKFPFAFVGPFSWKPWLEAKHDFFPCGWIVHRRMSTSFAGMYILSNEIVFSFTYFKFDLSNKIQPFWKWRISCFETKHCFGKLSKRVQGSLGNPPPPSLPNLHLFSLCFEQGVHPSDWKTANVVPVHKRKSRTDMKNYRPVSLLSVMSKVMEKVIKTSIMNYMEKGNLLSAHQFGFRTGLGAADLLTALRQDTPWFGFLVIFWLFCTVV